MARLFVYLLYNLLLPIVLAVGFPSFILKGIRRGGLARNFRQRFGRFRPETLGRFEGKRPLWIHAVSVGEIFIALKVVEAIRAIRPEQDIVLSTTTTTGYSVAEEKSDERLTVIHNPVDLPWVARRVARIIDPCGLVLIEAEIWPNLVALLKRRGVPVQLINARLSPRSAKRYSAFLPLIKPIFSQLDAVTVPFDADKPRWAHLGIPADCIHVLGSVKFDSTSVNPTTDEKPKELQSWLAETGFQEGHSLLLAASTHDGEEALLAGSLAQLRESDPQVELIIVPRHAERGSDIARQLEAQGWNPILRVAPGSGEGETAGPMAKGAPGRTVWIANTTGELRAWFPLADVVVVGKSFHGAGGQNPVEPILAGRPVVVGPNMQNFRDVVADLVASDGIRQLEDESVLTEAIREFLENPESGRAMAERGAAAMARHEGAATRSAEFIFSILECGSSRDESLAGHDRPPASP